ncbi:MurR/RpiR family transcriptional regulator [Marinilactibacillus psychrotolerans]|uniref:RpiR family transcriptional regulator n=1 Tax=Marinilactibacillus psychrotolerans TaxID=191770 RepID=A0A511H367_9LACT|nr:MurR/RpiR family transcriptional regulator [Marinilactibacillus psychrotolerans]TLQ05294.1 MurR/RpiR family transcriptional regulator [Marinilactibacillus psychrotolerans]SDD28787.1 transcriptional regulator, RpiR family [Marinilactibacillus psychrotolerans]GEL67961.1 RpiR family transcriptional regulator [Marinilactibacillus psychrotolerans]GEQ33302.1 RpiR family transcriptional regulator [Marinilactibacillus psychrotolerans]GEQ35670.1 RpiR family transcriptional regulator [Marinilactibaci
MENKQTCKMRIRSIYRTFSEKEKKLADYITASPEKIIHGTINQIADDTGLADSTVFRFCKRLGYKGFQDMKIALASEQVKELHDIHEHLSSEDNERTVLKKVFQSNIKTLEDTLTVIDEDHFKGAVNAMLKADRIELFGFGGSNVIALDGYHKFIRTGLPVSAQIDAHMQLMSASQMTDSSVAVLISHTGHSKDILGLLDTLKQNNVFTIGITSYTQSPFSQQVDIPLYTLSEETDFRSEALASRIAQLSLLDAIYVNIMMRLDEKGKKSITKVRNAIQNRRI